MGGMEFTWRMASTLAWPVVAIVVALVFRKWITEKVSSFAFKAGPVDVQVTLLDTKVDAVGQDISTTLSENMPRPDAGDAIPESLVDLIATVTENRAEGISAAFDLVHRALKENYPALRRVLPQQLPDAMRRLVDEGVMEADIALSVQQLYELLVMPEWEQDEAGDTRGYAFLMLAEGAIHGILRTAQARTTGEDPVPIGTSWRGPYNSGPRNNGYDIQLDITSRDGDGFEGVMTYPDDGTQTRVTGTIETGNDGVHLTWKEDRTYLLKRRRTIDFNGYYSATVHGDVLEGAWYAGDRRVAGFRMTAE